MKLAQLIDSLGLRLARGSDQVEITDLTDDSRGVRAGSLFIARSGAADDGRRYIDDAVARGAVAVIADQPVSDKHAVACVVGDRVDQALAGRLAERFFDHPSKKLKLIGITGTNGKTTTAFLVRHLLHAAGVKCGLIGTVVVDNGRQSRPASLTTPSAIDLSRWLAEMVDSGCAAAVMELSSHGLHQGRSAALDLAVAVFTNLTGDHLDYHQTMDQYAAAKAILFEQLGPEAWAIVNHDDPYADRMLRDCKARVVRCSLSDAADDAINCRATVLDLRSDQSLARFEGPWGSVEVKLPLAGRHNVANALHAVAAANCVTAMARRLREALSTCPSPPGRLEPVRLKETSAPQPTVLVDYAHTADALENVLLALRPVTKGRLIVVFGCGGDRDKTKRPKMAALACKLADRVVITSDNPRTEDPDAIIGDILAGVPDEKRGEVTVEPDRAKAIRLAILSADAADTVLLAGKGHEDYQIIGKVKHPFDDRVHAAAALAARAGHSTAQA